MHYPFTIAYNVPDKKVGCVLLNPLMGGLPGSMISRHFKLESWELSPTRLRLYIINSQEEFDALIELTNQAH